MADDNKIKRLNYFTGQFLEAEDFQDEQKYHTAMRRRLNTALRSPGILDGGFKVTVTQATVSIAARISVGAGIGVDNQGRELVILTSLEKEITRNDLNAFSNKQVAIYLGYDEKASDNKTADNTTSGNTRVTEEPVITIILSTAARPANSILLANLTIDAGGNISPPDESVRQLANLFVGERVEIETSGRAGLNINKGATNDLALRLSSSGPGWGSGIQFKNTGPQGKTYGIYSDSWSGSLHIADADVGVDRIVVDKDGNVGIGTTKPDAKLTIQTPEQYTGHTVRFEAKQEPAMYYLNLNTVVTDSVVRWVLDQTNAGTNFPNVLAFDRGNVGIGTVSPSAGLEINRRDTNHVALMLSSSGPGWGSGVQFKNTTPQNGKTYGIYSDSWSGSLHIADVDTGVDRIVVDKGGNVGIGTTEPKAKLDINGNALLGYETTLTEAGIPADFGAPIKSGFYQNGGTKITGDVPDVDHSWTHLIAARHSNTFNNHQLQIAASYASNDKLYFRKIASGTPNSSNPTWNELATRGTNQFIGNQSIKGNAGVLDIEGLDHAHIQFFPQGTSVRRGWVGSYPANSHAFTISSDLGRMHITGGEDLYLLNMGGVIVSKAWGGNGNLLVEGDITYVGNLSKLDVAEGDGFARIRAHDLLFGHSSRHGNGAWMGRALVDQIKEYRVQDPAYPDDPNRLISVQWSTLHINYDADWQAVYIGGVTYSSSSRQLKENIQTLSSQVAKRIISKLEPVRFTYKRDVLKLESLGFIAEDAPLEVASPNQDAIVINHIVAALTRVVKDQGQSIGKLEAQVSLLKNRKRSKRSNPEIDNLTAGANK